MAGRRSSEQSGRAVDMRRARPWWLAALLCAALAALAAAAAPALAARPNVVVIVTDDQTLESFNKRVMPNTIRRLAERGTSFSQGIVSTPQCCPSRAGYLTGQYSHNNDVTANRPGYSLLRNKRKVLPNWLREAGYKTIHIGKYLNGYSEARGLKPGHGWDRWKTIISADYKRPTWSIDGRFRADDKGYLTTTLNQMASRTAKRFAKRRQPFYLQVDQLAPHIGSRKEGGRCQGAAIPSPVDRKLFADATAPSNPATEESDLSDKPEFVSRNPPLSDGEIAKADLYYGCALASLKSVDRGVGSLLKALRSAGELGRTMIVFTSDNGYSYLEHRMPLTKGLPYEEHLRVPFVIRPPRGFGFPRSSRAGEATDAPVANIDLAPTILDLAKGEPCIDGSENCRRMDGRSLLPLLRGESPNWAETRAIRTSFSVNFDAYRRSCQWDGLRTPQQTFVEHVLLPVAGGLECRAASVYELYDLDADPFQLESAKTIPAALIDRLDALRRCSGIAGRDEFLPGAPFCE